MTDNNKQPMSTNRARFSVGNILLTLGIVIVSVLIALVLQAWYTTFLVHSILEEEIPPTPLEEEPQNIEVSISLEEKYQILDAIDAANPTSTLSTDDKKKVLRSLTTSAEQSKNEETQ